MQTQAIQRPRSNGATAPRAFNPSTYRAEALELMEANPKLAAHSMTQLATTKRETERELNIAQETQADLAAFLVSTALVALIGGIDGATMAKRDALIQTFEEAGLVQPGEEPARALWKAQGVKEPGKLWVIPTALLIPAALGIGAIIVAARREENDRASVGERVLAVTATTTFGVWVAGATRAMGYRWQQKRMLTAGAQAAMTGT